MTATAIICFDIDGAKVQWMRGVSPCPTRTRAAGGFYLPARGRRVTSAERFRLQGSRLRVLQRRQGISDKHLGMTVGMMVLRTCWAPPPPGMAVAYRRALRLHRRIFVSAACTTTHPDGTVAMRRLVQLGRCVTAGFRCRTERNWDTFRKQASQRTTAKRARGIRSSQPTR